MRKLGKKILGLALAATMVMGAATGCGKKDKKADESNASGNSSSSSGVQVGVILPTKDEPRW